MRPLGSFLLLLAVVSLSGSPRLNAGDWPQVLGPQRNGEAADESLAEAWPRSGPKTRWQREVGSGFAGVAVADGRAVLFHRVGDRERVEAMDAGTGEVLWTADFPAKYVPSYTNDDGPRAVPLIHEGRVYVYGARGGLHCLDLKTGKTHWTRDTFEDYNSKRPFRGEPPEGYFGIGSGPIVVRDKLLVNVGGDEKKAGIVAFSLDTGKTLWTATDERASYSSPVAADVDGVRHVIFATRLNAVSLDPDDGRVRFRLPFGRPGPTVTGANPTVIDGRLFLTASYGIGAVYAKIGKDQANVLWESDEVLSSQYTTCIHDDGLLYGMHGRQDVGEAELRCIAPETQQVRWARPQFGYATLIKADGKLLALKTDGELVLAAVDSARYRELARAAVLEGTARALPALSEGRLYIRDIRTLKCLDLKK